jgi:type IV pilus assembly protein PilC
MPQYEIRAADDRGQVVQQVEQADSENDLRERFRQQGYLVYSVKPQRAVLGAWQRRRERIGQEKFIVFNQQFVTLVRAGLPILRALELLSNRARDQKLKRLLESVREKVRSGQLLSQAFREHAGIPEIYTTTLMAGERSGNLEEVLTRYIHYERMALSIKRKLLSSLIYPAVLMVLVVAVLSFLVTYVVPRFGELYQTLGNAHLPSLTLFMLAVGNFTRHYFFLIPLILIGLYFLITAWLRGSKFGSRVDAAILGLPILGEIWWKYQVAMLSRTLGTLLLGGIPLVPALETSGTALRSGNLRAGLRQTVQDVREGKSLADSLGQHRVAPELAMEMIEVGESTGALPQMLASVADFYDEDLNNAMTRMMSLIEPAILIVVGTIVLLVLISLYLPLFTLYSEAALAH